MSGTLPSGKACKTAKLSLKTTRRIVGPRFVFQASPLL